MKNYFAFILVFTCSVSAFAETKTIQLESPAFQNGAAIPKIYTCDGNNSSPALKWTRGPEGTNSYAIIAEDPDAPNGTWTHWILYDLPPTVFNLPYDVPSIQKLANAEKHGINDFGNLGYGGPCPPSGTHQYIFRIYALKDVLSFKKPPQRKEFLEALEGKILAEGELMGKYEHHE